MEADEVYSNLSDKISSLQSKLDDNSSRFDAVRSDLSDLKSYVSSNSGGSSKIDSLASALDSLKSDVASLKDALNDLKSAGEGAKQSSQQGLLDQMKRIEEANAASERKFQEQQGLIGKLGQQAEEAGKMLVNFPETATAIAKKAMDDGKREILNVWEGSKKEILDIWDNGKKEILNSVSSITTPIIKEYATSLKEEIKGDLKSMIFDEVKTAQEDKDSKAKPLDEDEIAKIVKRILKEEKEG